MRKLTCHCGLIEIEIDLKKDLEDLYRCNCSMCIRKGAITAIVDKKFGQLVLTCSKFLRFALIPVNKLKIAADIKIL